jgi:hypothetical protein
MGCAVDALVRESFFPARRIGGGGRPYAGRKPRRRYDGDIMLSRTQIALDPEIQRRARRRAGDLGVSLAEYLRRLVAQDLGGPQRGANPSVVFDLGASGGSDVAGNKAAMLAEAFASSRRKPRRRSA